MRKATKIPTTEILPLGLLPSDLEHPGYRSGEKLAYEIGDHGFIKLYQVEGRKGVVYWVVATLAIGGSARGYAMRTYGVTLDGTSVRVGAGPHVKRTATVYMRESRVAALAPLIKLYDEGMLKSHQIRDRISSRRAEGVQRRMNGETYWRWSS